VERGPTNALKCPFLGVTHYVQKVLYLKIDRTFFHESAGFEARIQFTSFAACRL
jgi:hypothetical protein